MQVQKEFTPKMIYTVNIDQLVAKDNFYRLLKRVLDLRWIYKATEKYYGREGQESIDPVVFFKICLVEYLNGIHSDRKLVDYCSDSLSIRLFLGYDIPRSAESLSVRLCAGGFRPRNTISIQQFNNTYNNFFSHFFKVK